MIDEHGSCSGRPRETKAPVAVFDWDNTVTKNDITDLAIAWALKHDKILRPADWSATSPWMTEEADRVLTEACGTEVPVGEPLPTATDTGCTDEIFSVRSDGAWLPTPMFIEPLPKKDGSYPCATTGYTLPDGRLAPVRRADGSVIPDQEDRVHG